MAYHSDSAVSSSGRSRMSTRYVYSYIYAYVLAITKLFIAYITLVYQGAIQLRAIVAHWRASIFCVFIYIKASAWMDSLLSPFAKAHSLSPAIVHAGLKLNNI